MSDVARLVEHARVYAGEHDGHDTECPRCIMAGLADVVEQHTDCVDRASWDKLAVERHDIAAERDVARARVAALEATAAEVLRWREGDLPNLGYLRDNDKSREALAVLAALLDETETPS